jgi:hypothetical protein
MSSQVKTICINGHWLAAQMHTLAGAGKLKPLDDWLRMVRPRPKRRVSMIECFQALADGGAPINVTITEG